MIADDSGNLERDATPSMRRTGVTALGHLVPQDLAFRLGGEEEAVAVVRAAMRDPRSIEISQLPQVHENEH
jgi:hypothetical protein